MTFGAGAHGVQEVYGEVLQYLLTIVPAQRGMILLQQPGGAPPAPVAEQLMGQAFSPAVTTIDSDLVQRAMSGGEAVFVPSRIRGGADVHSSIQQGDTRCSIVAPLLAADGQAMGVVYLDSWDVFHQLDRRQVQWIVDAAAPAARAIERFAAQATFTGEGS